MSVLKQHNLQVKIFLKLIVCKKAALPINAEQLRYLIFVCGLNNKFQKLKSKCLQRIEIAEAAGKEVTLKKLV